MRARAQGWGESRGAGGAKLRDARRDRGKIRRPRKSVKRRKDGPPVSPGGAAGPVAKPVGKAAWSTLARDPRWPGTAERLATDAAQVASAAQDRAIPSGEGPRGQARASAAGLDF